MAVPLIKHHINPGDVFTLCKSVIDICKTDELKISHDHDLRNLVGEMEVMRGHLNTISLNQNTTCKSAKTAPLITRSLRPVHADLLDMQTFLKKHEERKKSVHVLEQARYAMLYKAQLKGWEEGMKRHRESVCAVGDVLGCEENESGNDHGKGELEVKRRESVFRLEGLVAREEESRRESAERLEILSELRDCEDLRMELEEVADLEELKLEKDGALKPNFNLDVFR